MIPIIILIMSFTAAICHGSKDVELDPAVLLKPAAAEGYLQPQTKLLGNSPLIVGGKESTPHAHPHQISLQVYNENGWYHICGGSVIRNDIILTAAHCVINTPLQVMRVVAGDHNLFLAEGTEQISAVSGATMHPQYNSKTYDFDYAVIHLPTNLTLNANVQVIPLAEAGTEPSGTCMNTGWGNTRGDYEIELPQKLQEIDLPIVDRATCAKYYETINNVTEHMVCAGQEDKAPCRGDSGGPLVCIVEGSSPPKKYLAGIVSWSAFPCAQPKLPAVFAHVGAQVEWIRAQLEETEVPTDEPGTSTVTMTTKSTMATTPLSTRMTTTERSAGSKNGPALSFVLYTLTTISLSLTKFCM